MRPSQHICGGTHPALLVAPFEGASTMSGGALLPVPSAHLSAAATSQSWPRLRLLGRRPARPRATAAQRPLPTRALQDGGGGNNLFSKLLFGERGRDGTARIPGAPGGGGAAANRNTDYLVLGGGVAAGYLAAELKRKGFARDRLCIASEEGVPPYERPSLSKGFFSGAPVSSFYTCVGSGGDAQDLDWYKREGIELLLNTRALAVDFAKQWVSLEGGGYLTYRKLFVATGSRARELPVNAGGDLPGVLRCRSLRDAEELAAAWRDGGEGRARGVVVVGGSFLALELAAAAVTSGVPVRGLSWLGTNKQIRSLVPSEGRPALSTASRASSSSASPQSVTVVMREPRAFQSILPGELAARYEAIWERLGVRFVRGASVTTFEAGLDGKVAAALLSNGDRLSAGSAVCCVGAEPRVEAFVRSGLDLAPGSVGGIVRDLSMGGPPPEHNQSPPFLQRN